MKYSIKLLLTGLVALSFVQCATPQDEEAELIKMMSGSFNSSKQAAADSSYYDISLHMVPIWTKSDKKWLYVEQAVTAAPDKPYRQRVYGVTQMEDGTFASKVYTLPNPEECIGKWKDPAWFDEFDPSILEEREGCTVYLKKTETGYAGSTREDECKSTLRGATYATSKVTITKDMVESWDQGFDDSGEQVWGATEAGYVFDRLESEKP